MASDHADTANTDFEHFLNSLPQDAFTTGDGLSGQPALADPGVSAATFLPSTIANDALLGAQSIDPFQGLEEPDYGKFENWIEGWIRPEHPCDYCRARKLDCHMKAGNLSCNSCITLFRECSLSNSQTLEAMNYAGGGNGNFFDTLHPVAEDSVRERGEVTGIKPLISKGNFSNGKRSSSPSPTRNHDDAPGSNKRNGIRFPRHALKVLRDWLDSHVDHPYPSEEEKSRLERDTELTPTQIANWLANARRRRKRSSRTHLKGNQSPSLTAATPAIAIPASDKPWDELNPFERWQHSPPENEPASVTDIVQAVANTDIPDEQCSISGSSYNPRHKSSNGSNFSGFKAGSIASAETDQSSWSAASSSRQTHGSHSSHASSFGSFSSSLAGKRERRRRRRQPMVPSRPTNESKKRIFQCTFCTDTFKSKYDWTRHEKSLHLSLEKWVCAPQGPIVKDRSTDISTCAYCGMDNPDDDHVEGHNHRQCAEKGSEARTFFRKDHLRQHLRLMHNCELLPIMEPWKSVTSHVNSRCGFCAKRFTVWQERVDHLTAHFKAGARMKEWKGCRGLDPAVAAQVTNAMPPYLIGLEQLSPVPFSASDRSTWCRYLDNSEQQSLPAHLSCPSNDSGIKTTCWERLTIRLGKFASEVSAKGVVLTDEMLQSQARLILYECDDPWNSTAADNPEWLDLFKKAHGLDFIPSVIGGEGPRIPEDLETYGDLGLRIPFAVQLKAYNEAHAASQNAAEAKVLGNAAHPLEKERKLNLQALCSQLEETGMLRNFTHDCGHTECAANTLDVGLIMGAGLTDLKRWCTYGLPPEKALELATQSSSSGSVSPTASSQTSSDLQRQLNLSQGLQSLFNLDSRVFRTENSSQALDEQDCAPEGLTQQGQDGISRDYTRRYRYELSPQQAKRFATITPAWADASTMPTQQLTDPPYQAGQSALTTGGMMEFLGGNIGGNLSFSQDAETSFLKPPGTALHALNPSPDGTDWLTQEGNLQHQRVVMENFERLMAEVTGTEQPQIPAPVTGSSASTEHLDSDKFMDFSMDDINFDDVNFDGVFDLDMGEGADKN